MEVLIINSGIGNVGTGTVTTESTTALASSIPLMFNAAGQIVAHDGTGDLIAYSPIGGASPGQQVALNGLQVANVDLDAPYVAGTVYYVQADGSISATVSPRYAGTAFNATTLIRVAETAARIAALNAPAPAPDPLTVDRGPIAATNKMLTQKSVQLAGSEAAGVFTPGATIAGTFATGTPQAAGSINYQVKSNGVHVALNLTTLPAGYTVFADLPAGHTYLNTRAIIGDANGQIGGSAIVISNQLRAVFAPATVAPVQAEFFVEYAT